MLHATESTKLQEHTSPDVSAQIFSALGAIRMSAGPLGLVCAGFATQHLGVRPVLWLASMALAVVTVIGRYLMPLAAQSR